MLPDKKEKGGGGIIKIVLLCYGNLTCWLITLSSVSAGGAGWCSEITSNTFCLSTNFRFKYSLVHVQFSQCCLYVCASKKGFELDLHHLAAASIIWKEGRFLQGRRCRPKCKNKELKVDNLAICCQIRPNITRHMILTFKTNDVVYVPVTSALHLHHHQMYFNRRAVPEFRFFPELPLNDLTYFVILFFVFKCFESFFCMPTQSSCHQAVML